MAARRPGVELTKSRRALLLSARWTAIVPDPLKSDACVSELSVDAIDAIVCPGGFAPDYMRRSPKMLELIVQMIEASKPVAAICHAPWMFCSARFADGTPVIKGYRATCFSAVKDDVINAGGAHTVDCRVLAAC